MTEAVVQTPLDVAAAVITRADGAVLLAQRPAGKPYAGYWEFPGGKLEEGEDARAALARELKEELGIDVETAAPWLTRVYAYPHRTVRLHFYRVLHWHGEPHGREGQALSWERPQRIAVTPLLPANTFILRALALPALYAITDAARWGESAFRERLDAALERGLSLIQVRDKSLAAPARERLARTVIDAAKQRGARVLINDDIALARQVGADGVHLSARALMQLRARPDVSLCAASCHSPDELARAAALELDFVVLSPVLPTASHPGAPTLGWTRFAKWVRDFPLPVYALGGMQQGMLETAQRHGAHGIALLSGIW